ncbi:MAG: M28 family peptidase, partial [Gaiellaceae bacterium]
PQEFEAEIPGRGRVRLRNLIAKAVGRSPDVIVVMAHRDDAGTGPGANDNASGTAALIELARAYARARAGASCEQGLSVCPAHTIVFVSTDGGAFGALGAAHFANDPAYRDRIVAVIDLDAIATRAPPRLLLSGDLPRSPPASLVQTAAERILEQAGRAPARPSAIRQLVDLGFPFSLYEHAPFVARGVPALTLTTAGDRPPPSFGDSGARLSGASLEVMGRSAQALVASLDQGLELEPGSPTYVYLGSRLVRGWAVQLVLIAALLPFLAAAVDLFARCRRRRIPLLPALRSFRSRLGFWLFAGLLFGVFAVLGAWPDGAARPLSPESAAAGDWPALGLVAFAIPLLLAWLAARERLLPQGRVEVTEELAGYTAALLVLAVLALVVIATNAFALLFLLPSLHAWIWLPQVCDRRVALRLGVFAAGLAGPLLLLGSFALRFGLGFDTPWYLATLVAVGYVELSTVIVFLVWLAASAQLATLAVRRYGPYPSAAERPRLGMVRTVIGRALRTVRARRRHEPDDGSRALEG